MIVHRFVRVLLLAFFSLSALTVGAQKYTLRVKLTDAETHEPLVMATVGVQPLGVSASTNEQGVATLANLPRGQHRLQLRYIGYVPQELSLGVRRDSLLTIALRPASLKVGEAVVTAQRNVAGAATSSTIGRVALDHLQATSLADVFQLVPGQLMGNVDLTSKLDLQKFQLRTLSNNSTAGFGTSVVMDGVPLSTNGELSQSGFTASAFAGNDLRQVSADDIESVEVVRGIASAEYGDLTSGLVVVNSRVGVSPWMAKGKVNPGLMNYSLGKGFNAGRAGVWNANLDYAQAWGDPRMKTKSFHRYTLSVGWGKNLNQRWRIDTKLRLMQARDWTGNDPDAKADGTEDKNMSRLLALTHNGRITLNRLLARTLSYTLGVQLSPTDARNTGFVSTGTGLLPILTATETGYYLVPWRTASYQATGKTESRSGNVFFKINDSFYLKSGNTHHGLKLGADYKADWNTGRGFYNLDATAPLRPNSNGRPRAFNETPTLHQMGAFIEDHFTWNMDRQRRLHLQAGLRFTALQPFAAERTFALSPRINVALTAFRWLELHAGMGMSSKTPGLDHLYPAPRYIDRVAANYMPQNDPAAQLLAYHTQVYQVERSKGLKNATSTKWEVGFDLNLPGRRKLNVTAYYDRTPGGFGAYTEYYTYTASYFTPAQGLLITPGAATQIDYAHPARQDLIFATTGRVGNTDVAINKGVEMDCDLGEIRPLHTKLYFSGAYQESRTSNSGPNTGNPISLPASYVQYGTTPVKLIYPSGLDFSRYRRFVNTLRWVTSIPALRLVASCTGQVVWHNSTYSYVAPKSPIGWIDANLNTHPLTPDMLSGYLGEDGRYYAAAPTGQESISLAKQSVKPNDNAPVSDPVTWNVSFRLTKELGDFAGISLFVNNALYYEPYLASSTTTTLSQRNSGTFSFGAELFFKF